MQQEESNNEFENFTNFVKRILRVPKSDIDASIRKEREEQKERDKDPLQEKLREKEKGNK